MAAHRHFLRLQALVCALVLAGTAAPVLYAASSLQIITTIVNIAVPAGAFDPTTGVAEVTVSSGLVLQVKSDKNWKVQVRATRATFDYVTPPGMPDSKPVSALQLRSSDGGNLLLPSTSFVEIAKGGKTHEWSEYAFDVILQATSDDAGGLYRVILEFKII